MIQQQKILVIRRDNIGDLVCTTPVFTALRNKYPGALICALVNTYNRAVLENNPYIDEIYAYSKGKHRPAGKTIIGVYWERLLLLRKLRRIGFDYAIVAVPGFEPRSLKLARAVGARHIIGFTDPTEPASRYIDLGIAYGGANQLHETEDVYRLLQPLGISGKPPELYIRTTPGSVPERSGDCHPAMTIGIHISARKSSQQWPVSNFAPLIRLLAEKYKASFRLFWSPGEQSNPLHPGDDIKAAELIQASKDIPLTAHPTQELQQLIAGLAQCDQIICSDGGAMHLAAGLGKPILCLFGKSDRSRWYPWEVPYVLLQHPSLDVKNLSVSEVLSGFEALQVLISGRARNC